MPVPESQSGSDEVDCRGTLSNVDALQEKENSVLFHSITFIIQTGLTSTETIECWLG